MAIVAIDDSDVNGSTSQSSGGEQAAEATAYDYDAMSDRRPLTSSEIGCRVWGVHEVNRGLNRAWCD